MKQIYIVGTSHGIIPKYEKDFLKMLKTINPDQIFVEIAPQHLHNKQIEKYPKEFILAYKWGIAHGKKVNGFDDIIDPVKSSFDETQLKKTNQDITEITEKHGWQQFNKPEYLKLITEKIKSVIDPTKHSKRENKMLKNVKKYIQGYGKILILTGSFHLPFFKKHFRDAILPLGSN